MQQRLVEPKENLGNTGQTEKLLRGSQGLNLGLKLRAEGKTAVPD